MTPEEIKGYKKGLTNIEGFLQLILEKEEGLSSDETKAYNRIIRYVRKEAGIPHKDYAHKGSKR